jgi:hypothetical protein
MTDDDDKRYRWGEGEELGNIALNCARNIQQEEQQTLGPPSKSEKIVKPPNCHETKLWLATR